MNEERRRVLEMLQAGTISAEEAAALLEAMGDEEPGTALVSVPAARREQEEERQEQEKAAEEIVVIEEPTGRPIEEFSPPWGLPLGIGLGLLMLGFGIFWVMSYLGNMNLFWFLCGMIPLGWAVVLLLVAAWLAWGLWLHVRVESADGGRVRFHLPLPPFGLAAWAIRLAGRLVPRLRRSALDEVLEALQGQWKRGERLVVNVDDEGDRVQVVIG